MTSHDTIERCDVVSGSSPDESTLPSIRRLFRRTVTVLASTSIALAAGALATGTDPGWPTEDAAASPLPSSAVASAGPWMTDQPSVEPAALPTFDPHPFPQLEARLPDSVAGHAVMTASLREDPATALQKTLDVLALLDATTAEMEVAVGEVQEEALVIAAIRVRGNTADDLLAAFRSVDDADPATSAVYVDATVGQRPVVIRTADGIAQTLVSSDDVLFLLSGTQSLVEALVPTLR